MRRARLSNADGENRDNARHVRQHLLPAGGSDQAAAAAAAAAVDADPPGVLMVDSDDDEDYAPLGQQGQVDSSDLGDGEDEEEISDIEDDGDQIQQLAAAADFDPDDDDDDDDGLGEDEEDDQHYDDGDLDDEDGDDGDDGDDLDINGGMFIYSGGIDYDIIIGGPPQVPARATGTIPQTNPTTDTQIAPGVYARRQPDGHHCLFGSPLQHVPKLLERMFGMRQQAGQLLWRSSLELTDAEWSYITGALSHERIRPLLESGHRVLAPLPDVGFPARLRPRDNSGEPLRGPRIAGNSGKPWNRGRQYFSSYKSNDFSSFIWSDGVRAMEPEAQESFNQFMGPMAGLVF